MLTLFARYATVGVINTAVHWVAFLTFFYVLEIQQASSNLLAFCIAVTFSFVVNAKYTFKKKATCGRYVAYVVFMGLISVLVGWAADAFVIPPLFTLVLFSAISLVLGFIYSKFLVFSGIKQ